MYDEEDIDVQTANELAKEWYKLADTDENGVIIQKEFVEFVKNLDSEYALTEYEILN